MLESNINRLVQELQQLASRVKQPDQHQRRDAAQGAQGQYLVVTGRS